MDRNLNDLRLLSGSLRSGVSRLFFWRGPFAISLAVIPVIINSVKGFNFGRKSHISQKAFELVPSLTNLYSASTVVRVPRSIGVLAPLKHIRPDSVRSGSAKAVPVINQVRSFLMKATTRLGASVQKVASSDSGCISASTLEKPAALHPIGRNEFYRREATTLHPCYVAADWHARIIAGIDSLVCVGLEL